MQSFSKGPGFAHLSLEDLLRARDQFHPHLVHKRNVVGTAVGRYLIRSTDPLPGRGKAKPKAKKEPRTLEKSEVRDYSWPCVLVFVDEWVDEESFGKLGEIPASDYIPKTIYLPDGKSVPICVVLAPPVTTPPPPPLDPPRYEREGLLQGGARVVTTIQNVEHAATIGCLLTDGHKVYALTSRHVAGEAGEQLKTEGKVVVGTTSHRQLGRLPFEDVYAPWPGKRVFVNLDVALVEVDDLRLWSSGIRDIGAIAPLAELSTDNISLNLIGCPVRTFGAGSGRLDGRIAALFYRYKSVAGFDYVADFLIGSRTSTPLATVPGDSGAVWVVDDPPGPRSMRGMPFAVQWGGTVLGQERTTFALASNLSTIARELNVDVYRGPDVAAFEYWGELGHRTIGQRAARLVKTSKLNDLFDKNATQMGWLANVPDKRWKRPPRKKSEGPTHYADMDYRAPETNHKSLDDLTPSAAKLNVDTWRKYYDKIGWLKTNERGLLPFRVWQVYRELVGYIRRKDVHRIVAAAGVFAHYIGDACQPLHSTVFTNGDPFHDGEGEPVDKIRGPFDDIYGSGVHSAYETNMLDDNEPDLRHRLDDAMPKSHGMTLIETPREAAWAAIELMRRARRRLPPEDIVETYVGVGNDDPSRVLWRDYKEKTVETIVDGCRVLAMLWDSAWAEGDGDAIDDQDIVPCDHKKLIDICDNDPKFLASADLDHIKPKL